jgi:hypothetical protein
MPTDAGQYSGLVAALVGTFLAPGYPASLGQKLELSVGRSLVPAAPQAAGHVLIRPQLMAHQANYQTVL